MKFLLTLFVLTSCSFSFAYPIFYTCEDGKIISSKRINDKDLFTKIMAMDKSKRTKLVQKWCSGSTECLKDFQFLIDVAGTGVDIAQKLFQDKLVEYKESFKAIDLSEINPDEHSKLINGYSSIRACQDSKAELNANDFVKGQKVITPYPYLSDYSYAGFCPQWISKEFYKGEQYCDPIDKNSLDKVIEEAVIMGTDPYLAISISLMEGGTGNIGSLYLDPIGVMGAIGCSSQQVANNSNSDKALNSFGTSYIVNAEVKRNTEVTKKLEKYFTNFDIQKEVGKSYFCYDTLGGNQPEVYDKPQSNSCCLDLGFKTDKSSSDKISHALTYTFINKTVKSSFRKKADPSWRIQRFNGYTDLMGAAEGVSPWRAGVNYYKNPAYGYQAMDFLVNSIMLNPYIKSKVEQETEKRDKNWNSIMCKGKANGTFYLDSDYYQKKHKESPRLESIHAKSRRGVQFKSLTRRERKIMDQELIATAMKNSKMPDILPSYLEEEIRNKLYDKLSSTHEEGSLEILKTERLSKDKWKLKIKGAHTLKDYELNAIYEISQPDSMWDELYEKENEISNKVSNMCNSSSESVKKECEKVQNYMWGQTSEKPQELVNSELSSLLDKYISTKKEISDLDKQNELKHKKFGQKYGYLMSKSSQVENVMRAMDQIEPFESAVKRLSSNKSFDDEAKAMLLKIHKNRENQLKGYSRESAYKEYFQTIYKSRNQIHKSSRYPWRRLTEEEIKKIVEKYNSFAN